jgi:HK97 family phage major capsid protein
MNARELRMKRKEVLDQAQAVIDAADQAKRELSAEERTEVDGLMTQAANMLKDIEQREQLEGLRGELRESTHQPGMNPELGMGRNDLQSYSIVRAVRAIVNAQQGNTNALEEAGLEMEASRAVAKRLGREPRGFFVPYDVLSEQRAVEKGGTASGAQLVATEKLTGSFIEMLRNRMVTRTAGATVLGGLVGDISIPKMTGGATAYWVAEGGAPTGSNPTVGQLALTPKTVGAFTEITRKMLLQSSMDVEELVRSDLASTLALALDLAALHGSGSANQPTGIASTSGIGSVVGGANGLAPAWSHIVGLESEVSVDNADVGRLAYITNAKVRGKLKQTAKVATTDSVMIWDNNNSPLNGYPALVSNQVSSTLTKGTSTGVCSAIFFGNWVDLVYALWGVLDVLVNPYILDTTGAVRVTALQDADLGVRHAESFSAMLDALTA